MTEPLFNESEWSFQALDRVLKAVEEIALEDLKLDVYPNQIEIISSEQMLDAYSSLGMPLMYHHWSFGKLFAREEGLYRAGHIGLAYEMVINSNPSIAYLMRDNSLLLQILTLLRTDGRRPNQGHRSQAWERCRHSQHFCLDVTRAHTTRERCPHESLGSIHSQ